MAQLGSGLLVRVPKLATLAKDSRSPTPESCKQKEARQRSDKKKSNTHSTRPNGDEDGEVERNAQTRAARRWADAVGEFKPWGSFRGLAAGAGPITFRRFVSPSYSHSQYELSERETAKRCQIDAFFFQICLVEIVSLMESAATTQ